jgi:eukaryotic-like serine/threonine-protein kinase
VRTISHYRLEQELGRGGMGVVHRAVDTRLGRAVAIKVLPAEAAADPDRRRRFVQEARAASALNHPHIVTIYDIDEHEGTTFIAMELVDGTPLDRLIARGPLPLATALEYGAQIASALSAAHGAGIVHRDIKPANVVITADGRAKVLDFGLAKLAERPAGDATVTAAGTRAGTILGTAAYMSPEQAQGLPADARSDLFSLGAVIYEMTAGRRPFAGSSDVGVLTAILRDDPPPLGEARPATPADVEALVTRALAKDPAARYQDAAALRDDLLAAHARLTRPPDAAWRRPRVLAPAGLLLVALAALAAWQIVQARRAEWARREAIPEIERLQISEDRSLDAVHLARAAARYAPDDVTRVTLSWVDLAVATEPEDAMVEIRNYTDLDGSWQPLGRSPVSERVPLSYYRLRVSKPGYRTAEFGYGFGGRTTFPLVPDTAADADMLPIEGGPYVFATLPEAPLPDFLIDRYEVTNAAFKQFVDAGGYADPRFWTEPFRDGDRVLTFEDAMARFRDRTNRPGPATWEFGSYPEGQRDFPVGGISWFEAAAYANFAGKSLPTVYHWYKAAGVDELFSGMLRLSNFDSRGPVRVGERQAVGPWGAHDMAGNVKEWCANATSDTHRRYVLGGGWFEPAYRFNDSDMQNPWHREPFFGVRLVRNLGPVDPAAARPIDDVTPDPQRIVPAPPEQVDLLARFYAYDKSPLDARTDAIDDAPEHWRMETVSFKAAYGDERVPAYLFLPKHVAPPYKTVILFPSAYSRAVASSRHLDYDTFDFIMRSGRALLYPVYQGTFERRRPEPPGMSAIRDLQVQWAKDFFRAVDYLETRPDLAMDGLTYYSLSMGAFFGPIPVALEPRIQAAIFVAGGLRFRDPPPEIQPANFMPRVTVPVLIVNGRDDYSAPPAAQQRFYDLLGTPPEHKRLATLDGGHMPSDRLGIVREVLDWLDRYQGPVTRR